MIEGFSLSTAHCFGDALASQARLRHRVFVERRHLDHETYDGMEYDAFDTPAAYYLVWRDDSYCVRGLIRLLPTTRPYMLQTCWPELVAEGPTPAAPDLWEITRVCVDKQLAPELRCRILPELLCGVAECFERFGVNAMIGVTRPHLIEHFIRRGVRWLGPAALVEGEMERAFMVPREHIRPAAHLRRYGISTPVLRLETPEQRLAA
jgi:acyl homoserine lactone synthase